MGGFAMKKDCFAYTVNGFGESCLILVEDICKKKECPFYKRAEDYVKGFEYYPEYKELCQNYGVEPSATDK